MKPLGPAPLVTAENGPRPPGPPDSCFYCRAVIGQPHEEGCTLWTRPVRLRAVIEFTEDMPAHWGDDMILFARNDGTWCASNLITDLHEKYGVESDECPCEVTRIELADQHGQVVDVSPAPRALTS